MEKKVKIVISHRLHDAGMKVLEDADVNVVITNSGEPKDMLPALRDADGVIIRIGSIDRATMEQCPKLRAIGRPGVGVDDVDVAAATELGIPVVIAPGANTRSVAEHAMAMMFACAKDLIRSDREMRKGNFAVRSSYKAYELQGRTLGLIGSGAIGSVFAEMAAGIGMKILVYDPYVPAEKIEAQGYGYRTQVEDILREADVVSIHTPLTDATRGMIGEEELRMMKPDGILINCARGGIVAEAALGRALDENWIHSAGTDVVVHEPIDPKDPIFAHESIVVSPHMAGQTREAAAGVATLAAKGVLAVIRGEKWAKICNPKAYEHARWSV